MSPNELRRRRTVLALGDYAGIVTRTVAYFIDLTIVFVSYIVGLAITLFVIFLLSTQGIEVDLTVQIGAAAGYLVWSLAYFWYGTATFGKTVGQALLGLLVVMGDGSKVGILRSLVRVVMLPVLLVATLGLSALGVVFGRRHRALHDVVAGTVVIYEAAETHRGELRVAHSESAQPA